MCPPGKFPQRRKALRSKSVNCSDPGELIALLTDDARSFAPGDSSSDNEVEDVPRVRRNSFVVVSSASAPKFMRRNRSAQAALLVSLAEGTFIDEEESAAPSGPEQQRDGPTEEYVFMTAAASAEEEQRRVERQARKDARNARRQFMKDLRKQIDEAKRRHRTLSISAGSSAPGKPAWRRIVPTLTQPAHLVLLLAAVALGYVLKPSTQRRAEFTSFDWFCGICHVVAFTTEFGSQMWMTFVSGLALFFQIPRHTFGVVQRVLFPLYFLLNSVWAFIVLATYTRLHGERVVEMDYFVTSDDSSDAPAYGEQNGSTWIHHDSSLRQINFQVVALTLVFVIQLAVRLFLAPSLVVLSDAKAAIEKAAGVGNEVGRYELGDLRRCPHFMRMHKAFRRVHVAIAICNMTVMFLNCIHLLHLANIVVANFG